MEESMPDLLGQAAGPVVEQLNASEQRVLLALLERQAAQTYRRLAAEARVSETRQGVVRAAENEDSIARVLEALDLDYGRIARELHARFRELHGLFASVLNGRSYEERPRLQQAAEFGAANLFRALADGEPDAEARQRLLECAGTELENAAMLRAQLA